MSGEKTKRVCQKCGKPFYGSKDRFYCEECAKLLKSNVMRVRTCQDCGTEFIGGPRAKRCPDCAEYARTHKKRKPTARPLGSIDKCALCGAEYTVRSGRQKYCSETCQRIAVKEWQREHKKGYAKKSGQDIKKQNRRQSVEKICVYCLRPFKSEVSTNLCSEYCREEQKKLNQCKAEIKRGHDMDIEKYISKRDAYREVVKNKMIESKR